MTDAHPSGENSFACGAQWPRWHVFYENQEAHYDSALIEETLRQATILICHQYYSVPLANPFLLERMGVVVRRQRSELLSEIFEPSLSVRFDRIRRRDGILSACRSVSLIQVDGISIAYASAVARVVSPQVYRRLRSVEEGPAKASYLCRPDDRTKVSAQAVGKSSWRSVCIDQQDIFGRWPLIVDPGNPIFFDHPLDHVPGMLLLEAMRQAARTFTGKPGADFTSVDVSFDSVVEIGVPAFVELDLIDRTPKPAADHLRLSIHQADALCVVADAVFG